MKKILSILVSVFVLSGNIWSQIDFKRLTMQLPNSTSTVGAVKIGDLTNDGLNDVLVGSAVMESGPGEFNLYLYVQKTDGSLADPIKINVAATYQNVYDIEIADMNNDHLNDIVVGYGGSVGIFYQLPTGGFSAMTKLDGIDCTYGIKIGDLNNDGLKDIVGYDDSSNFKIFYQNKTGGFTLTTIPSKTWYCTQVELADVNGDNLVDLIKIYGSQIEIKYQQNGVDITKDSTLIINLHNKNSSLSGIAIGDLNKDGRNDIAVAYGGNSGQYNIYYQKPDGHMDTTNVKTGPTYDCPTPIRIADLNCDGDNEMIIGHSGWENISVYNKHGLADYNTYKLFPAMYYFNLYSMAVGDINNDHSPDIVTVGQNGKIDLLYNNSKPLTFDSYDHIVANFQMKRDTTDIQTVNYIPITDNSACKKNRSVRQLITGTYANENYSGDSLLIRHGTLCSSFTDTVKTSFTYIKRTLLKQSIAESIANFDTLTTTSSYVNSGAAQSFRGVYINSNICWNVQTDSAWIKPVINSGKGNMNLYFNVDPNLKTTDRTGTITISGDSIAPVQITVYQYAASPFINSPTSVIVLSEKVNNTAYFEITSNIGWYITQNVDWITIDNTVGWGNEEITVLAGSNDTGADRNGIITLFGSGYIITKNISVIQLQKYPNAIQTPTDNEFRIYPNPVTDVMRIESDQLMTKAQIEICEMNGSVIRMETMTGSQTGIDVSTLQKGIYLVKIITDTKTIVQKIIKQ